METPILSEPALFAILDLSGGIYFYYLVAFTHLEEWGFQWYWSLFHKKSGTVLNDKTWKKMYLILRRSS